MGFKTIIHEQNSIAGKANLYLSRFADKVCVSFKSSEKYFPKEKVIFTGNPVSEAASKIKDMKKEELDLDKNKKLVLFVMGSLGANRVNEKLKETMTSFKDKDYSILWVTGKDYYDNIKDIKIPSNVKIVPYIDDLVRILPNVDLLVTRAGASTLSEIITLKVPAILIPSPYVANNHQYKNAYDLVSNKSALLLEEKDLNKDTLVDMIDKTLKDKDLLLTMKNNLVKFQVKDSATSILHVIEDVIK